MIARAGRAMVMVLAALAMTACRAEIRGTVVVRAEALPGATVTLRGPGLPEPRRAVSDRNGHYSFPSLKPGRYTVETSLSGFDAPNRELILTPGSVANLDVIMIGRPKKAVFGLVDAHGGTGAVADEVGIRALVTRFEDASEAGDPKMLEPLFTDDADQLGATGEWRKGRDDLVHGGRTATPARPGSRHIAIEGIRFVAPDVATVDGRSEIPGPPATAPRRMRTMFVVVRDGQAWRIAAIRTMVPTDPAR
jgi:uncharacterized protein (TIGR02246 family)